MDKELLKNVLDDLKKGDKDYFQTGLKNLDSLCKIPQKGAFILLGGRPSMGKTSFIFSIILNIVEKNEKMLLFSPDYSKEIATKKLLFLKSGLNKKKYYDCKLNDKEWEKLAKSATEMASWNINICDDSAVEFGDIVKKISEQRPKIVFIDDIDSVKLIGDKTRVLADLQKLAHEKECIIFATTTLSRSIEERKNHRPMLSDLKEYKDTKFVNIVLLLYREAYYGYRKSPKDSSPNSEIIVEKNMYNQIGGCKLEFDENFEKFYEKEIVIF